MIPLQLCIQIICSYRYRQLSHNLKESNIMKVKFISKKQREQLKAEKTDSQPPASHHSQSSHNNDPQESTRLSNSHQQVAAKPNRDSQDKVNFSQHFMGVQRGEGDYEPRERSRDNKYQFLAKEEMQERNKMKNRMLGLTKAEISQRKNVQYRNQLLFQWDKSEDTTQGFVPILKPDTKPKDFLESQSLEGWKTKPFQRMEERDWRIFREDHQIYIRGGKAPNPIRQWTQLQGVSQQLVQNLLALGFQKPKPIQMQAIPIGLAKRDLMAIAPTGQGKTLAYLLPIVQFLLPLPRLSMQNFDSGPYAMVVVPTRELAEQIEAEWTKITRGLGLKAFVAVGGYQFQLQAIQLSKGCELLIATPGRAKQFIQKHHLSLQRLAWCVVDQADKMVSENLSQDLQFLLSQEGNAEGGRRVVHMFSATMIPEIEVLGKAYLAASFTYITIGEPGGGKKEIEQHVQLIDEGQKLDRLTRILRNIPGPIIVFANSRENCDKVSKALQLRCERRVAEYHGGKSQDVREKVIANLRSGKVQILVATDLAGRGLDVKGINAVVNYDAPKNISEFIHRSGRTGRAGMKGKAFTLLTPDDQALFYDLRVFLERNGFSVPQNIRDNPASQVRPGGVLNVARRKQIVYTN